LPWFLDLINDINDGCRPYYIEEDDPEFTNCPRVQDYKIGSYWDRNTDSKETLQFIFARVDWAEKIIRKQLVSATQFYKHLNAWDLNGLPPREESLPF